MDVSVRTEKILGKSTNVSHIRLHFNEEVDVYLFFAGATKSSDSSDGESNNMKHLGSSQQPIIFVNIQRRTKKPWLI